MTRKQDMDWKRRATAAEAALEVVKAKVVSLYDGGSRSVISRQLERARAREVSNQRRRELMQVRQEEMERYTKVLEEQVHERTRAIRTILDNVTFGFLLVDRRLGVCPGFTASCTTLFGRGLSAGATLTDLLGLAPRMSATFLLLADQVFEDILPERVSLEQLPQRFPVGDRVLRLEAKAIRDDEGSVEQLLITVSDVTALENARRDARTNQTIVTILSHQGAFVRFIADTRDLLDEALVEDDPSIRRRYLHTVKGNCASWGLDEVTALVHDIEDQAAITAADVDCVHRTIERYLDGLHHIIGVRYRETPNSTRSIDINEIRHLREVIEELDPSPPEAELRRWATNVALVPAEEFLGPLDVFSERLASRLGKEVELRITGGDTLVDPEALTPVLRNLTHLLRNSIDHGIERPSERGTKPHRGLIEVKVSSSPSHIDIEVSDDGRGVDIARLSEKALAQRAVQRERLDTWTDEEKLELIFLDGLSCSDEATELSGRGVGMAAIRAAARRQAGEVRVRSEPGAGTSILVRIPKPDALRRAI